MRNVVYVPTSKAELLTAICVNFDRLMVDLSKVPEGCARNKSLEGHAAGTHMSPTDLVSYLVGWNELVLKWLDQDDRGVQVDFPETGFKWSQLFTRIITFSAIRNCWIACQKPSIVLSKPSPVDRTMSYTEHLGMTNGPRDE